MFGGGSSTEYEDIVNKATDENLTSENWELILNLCDKVQDEGQEGAHAAIASILKRLAHRNPNVQLYALSLAESLSKNLGIEIHRELASRAFTQGLEKLITDRNTHEKVRKRALGLIAMWAMEFENDTTLGIMEECYDNLKSKNYKFEQPQEAPPPTVDDEIRRKEEEELQRVLEMSMQDKGGRNQWSEYSLASGSSSGAAAASGSSSSAAGKSSAAAASSSSPSASGSSSSHPFSQPKYQGGGYVPARTPSPTAVAAQQRKQQEQYHKAQAAATAAATQQQQHQSTSHHHHHHATTASSSVSDVSTPTVTTAPAPDPIPTPAAMSANGNIVTRVRALHTFEPTEPGELAFEKGDIIKVVDRGYKDWWRGQLKGRTGIFPVNYVESMPEPTAAELAKEAEQEAAVFSQAVNVEKLLNMLRALDPAKDNLADNEEIQELYRSSMALRPKIVKLIDKYSQKRADLVSMNETFVRARTIFDRMMEESLARHSGVYEQQPTFRPSQFAQARPDSRGGGRRPEYGPGPGPNPQPYVWGGPNAQPAGYGAYPPQQPNPYGGPIPGQPGPESPYGNPNPTPAPGLSGPQGIPPQQQGIPPQQGGYIDPNAAAAAGGYGSPQGQPPQKIPGGYGVVPQGGYAGVQPNVPYTQQGPTPYPAQQQQQQPPVQPQPVQQQQPLQQPLQPLQAQAQQPQPIQQQPVVVQQPQPIQQQLMQQQPIQQQPMQQQPVQQQPVQQQPIQQQPIQQPTIQAQPQPMPQQQPQPIQQQPVQQAYPQHHELQPIQTQLQPEPIQEPSPARNTDSASPQPVLHAQVQPQPQVQPEPQPQPQVQPQPQQPISGPPPYVYDASYTYADPNVQAWAQYYAQGGRDLAGSVYFISIPGVTDGAGAAPPAQEVHGGNLQRQQSLQAQQQQVHGGQHHNLQRHQSLQGQQQQVQQQRQQHPIESEIAYASSGLTNNGGRATSPVQHQQLQGLTRYQLSDQPTSSTAQSQPQYANQYQQPGDLLSGQKQSSPSGSSSSFSARPGTAGSSYSPTQTASTPSWVLPKKGAPASGMA